MKIYLASALNHSVDQYKLLSSTAGVGSVINTRLGFSIMPLSIENWGCIQRVQAKLNQDPSMTPEEIEKNTCVVVVNDDRFVEYLKKTNNIHNLIYLVDIPRLQLDERFNTPKVSNHPLYKKYLEPMGIKVSGVNDYFVVPGIIFPRWMVSQKSNCLHPYEYWKDAWKHKFHSCISFAPPRDVNSPTGKTYIDREGEVKNEYALLSQMPFVLICDQGHISDIPWDKYFSARLNEGRKVLSKGFDLFGYTETSCEKGGNHEIFYQENRNHSEGFGMLKCIKCGEVVSLEGIMNMSPKCSREKPWVGIKNGGIIEKDNECINHVLGQDSTMRVALTTSNSIYYCEAFSSLYIPNELVKPSLQFALNDKESKALDWLNDVAFKNYQENNPGKTSSEYWEESYSDNSDFVSEINLQIDINLDLDEVDKVKKAFLENTQNIKDSDGDKVENYRFVEYDTFCKNPSLNHSKLKFNAIELTEFLGKYFDKICQVSSLCVTKVQTEFYRVSMPVPIKTDKGIFTPSGQKIFGEESFKIKALPANQMYGEGLFFKLNEKVLKEWSKLYSARYKNRDEKIGKQISDIIDSQYGAGFYVLHTLAHIIIKELEFTCGYSSSSLSERIYFSNRMAGFLIYTTDGAEGGMGGLVWQGKPKLIDMIIKKALIRAMNCSSDPICWENDESLNYAACFSCAMISETSCEYRNLGLDRRALIDSGFGFFKELL